MTFVLQKTIGADGGHGCVTLSTPDRDSLFATYDLSQGNPYVNGFVTAGSGKLAFTGGSAKGNATFTAVFGPGIAFYTVDSELPAGHGALALAPRQEYASGTGALSLGVAFDVIGRKILAGFSS